MSFHARDVANMTEADRAAFRASAQFVANVVDDQLDVAVRADHPRQIFAQDRPGGGEQRRLDPAHPFAPARRGRQVLEFAVEFAAILPRSRHR